MDTVVASGIKANKGANFWIGTGFLVGRLTEPGSGQYHVFLVTNKHVLKDQKDVFVRFNPQSNEKANDYGVPLVDKQNNLLWIGHPTDSIDVAATNVNFNLSQFEQMKCAFFASDKHSMTIKQLAESGVSEGDVIFVLGFPPNLVDIKIQYVIARIKDLSDKFSKDFLVESFVFPGNIGGPVIIKPEFIGIQDTKSISSASLIGMVQSYSPYRDTAVSQQTKEPRIVFVENSGLASVIPTDSNLETMELAYSKQILETMGPEKKQGKP